MVNDGGPAFPIPDGNWNMSGGMSLRDYFAGLALAGLIRNMTDAHGLWNEATAADAAYLYADAMIQARERAA